MSTSPGVAKITLLLVTLGFPSLLTWTYFVVLAGAPSARAAYGVGKLLQFAAPVVWLLAQRKHGVAMPRFGRRGVVSGLLFGAGVATVIVALYHAVLKHEPQLVPAAGVIHARLRDFGLDSAGGLLAIAVFYSVLHSLLEEGYWRWFAFGELARGLPTAAAIVLTSLGFMAHHVVLVAAILHDHGPITWLLSLGVAAGGAVWAWIYRRSGSLLGPWLSHALVDAALMAVGFDLAFG